MTEDSVNRHRRRVVQFTGLTIGGAVAGASGAVSASDGDETAGTGEADDGECLFDGPGLVTVRSDRGFEATVSAVEDRIEASPLELISTVDHAANAESVGMDLPPTTLLAFGNPAIGTQLMEESRTVGIDLPQKILVWCDDDTVRVTYNDPEYLAARHGIEGKDELLSQISNALRNLVPDQSGADGDGQ